MAQSLTSLAIFRSVIRKEMVRSLHVYGSVEIEREFLFESKSRYVEKKAKPLFRWEGFRRREISEGSVFGRWRCIFLFRFNHSLPQFPTLLCLSRNPKLEDIPNLANELKFISVLKSKKPSERFLTSWKNAADQVGYCELDQPKPLKLVFMKRYIAFKIVRLFSLNHERSSSNKIFPDAETESEESGKLHN